MSSFLVDSFELSQDHCIKAGFVCALKNGFTRFVHHKDFEHQDFGSNLGGKLCFVVEEFDLQQKRLHLRYWPQNQVSDQNAMGLVA